MRSDAEIVSTFATWHGLQLIPGGTADGTQLYCLWFEDGGPTELHERQLLDVVCFLVERLNEYFAHSHGEVEP